MSAIAHEDLENRVLPTPPAETIVAARDLSRRYGAGDTAVDALRGVSVDVAAGRADRRHGPVGLGQVDAHAPAGRARPADGGRGLDRRHRDPRLGDGELTQLRRAHIGFVFQFFNLLPMLTAEENILLPLELAGRSRTAAGSTSCRARSASATGARTGPPSSPAASSSASRSPARWSPGRPSCSPTSRPATSTRRPAPRSSTLLRDSVATLRPDDRDGHPRRPRGRDRRPHPLPGRRPRSSRTSAAPTPHEILDTLEEVIGDDARRAQRTPAAQAARAAHRARRRARRRDGQRHLRPDRHDPEGASTPSSTSSTTRPTPSSPARRSSRTSSSGDPTVPRLAAADVRALPGVAAAAGGSSTSTARRLAKLIGATARRSAAATAPSLGFGVDPEQPRFSPLDARRRAPGPTAPTRS